MLRPVFFFLCGLIFAFGAQAADCTLTPEPGQQSLKIQSGGMEREALLFVPTHGSGRPAPLLLDLHGSESSAATQLRVSQWQAVAEAQGALLVAPQGALPAGRGWRWNVPGVTRVSAGTPEPDDEQFLDDVIAAVSARACVDSRRIYASGYSGGARMVAQWACDQPDRVAAVGLVSGLRAGFPRTDGAGHAQLDPASCAPKRAVPVVAFAGTADKINPFDGGGESYWHYDVMSAFVRWGAIDGCTQRAEPQAVSARTQRLAYAGCRSGAQVLLYVSRGAGHAWPGSRLLEHSWPALMPSLMDIDATALMWQFFATQRLP